MRFRTDFYVLVDDDMKFSAILRPHTLDDGTALIVSTEATGTHDEIVRCLRNRYDLQEGDQFEVRYVDELMPLVAQA
jgi:hypothetical protein